jgi:gluconokinase
MIVILMGVSGCGKTAVGRLLAERLGWRFFDADEYHPSANVEKMRSGTPLTDADRWPWLERLNELLRAREAEGESAVLGCSALRQVYRDRLARGCSNVLWVHLKGSFELIQARLQARLGHYMPASLLKSQFDALEEPRDALVIDITDPPEVLAARIAAALARETKSASTTNCNRQPRRHQDTKKTD